MKKQLWKLVAVAATCVFGFVTLSVSAGGGAFAVELGESPSSLTIHKYTTPADETEGDGTLKPPSNDEAKPVEGVEYTVYPVKNIDLNKNEDWLKAAQLQASFEANPSKDTLAGKLDEDQAQKKLTDNMGIAKFTFEPNVKRLYLVVESSIAGAKVDGHQTNVVGSKPFLVAVPMTDRSTRDKWNYDVHVYPKNAPVTAVKTVDDTDARAVGQDVVFTISTDIPDKTGTPLNKYVVLDQLNTAQYMYKSVTVSIKNADSLTAQTDYTISSDNGLVRVALTKSGLEKLEKHRGGKLVTLLKATIQAVNTSDGEYANTAYVVPSTDYSETLGGTPGKPDHDGKIPPIPSNKVTEKFAKIVVNKVGTDGKKLAGAKFELYTCTSKSDLSNKIVIGDHQDYVTAGADGTVTIDAVRLSDFYNGQEQSTHHKYCLKEVSAPKGYELLPEPVELDVTANQVNHGVFTVSVKDVPYNAGFHLPLTGSSAVILLGVIGVLLLGGGVLLVTRNRQHS